MDIKELLINSATTLAFLSAIGVLLKGFVSKILDTYIDAKFAKIKNKLEAHSKVLEGFLNNCHEFIKDFPSLLGKVIRSARELNEIKSYEKGKLIKLKVEIAALEDLLHSSKIILEKETYLSIHEFKEDSYELCRLLSLEKDQTNEKRDVLIQLEEKRQIALSKLENWAEKLPGIKEMKY